MKKDLLKVAIVCDNYKVEKFKEELIASGLDTFTTKKFTHDSTAFKIHIEQHRAMEIKKICLKVQMHFKQSN